MELPHAQSILNKIRILYKISKKFEGYLNTTKEAERKEEPLSLFVYTFATSRKPLQVSSKLTCKSDKDNKFHNMRKKKKS